MAILLFTIGPTDLEIYQNLGVTATKRLLEVDSLTSIDLSNIVGVIVHLPSDYVYVSKSSRAKDCRAAGVLLRTMYAHSLIVKMTYFVRDDLLKCSRSTVSLIIALCSLPTAHFTCGGVALLAFL